jgi:hypothetical protein
MPDKITAEECALADSRHDPVPDAAGTGLRTLAKEAVSAGFGVLEGVATSAGRRMGSTPRLTDVSVVEGNDGPSPRGLVLRPALLGFAAMVCIAIGASMPSSPFKLELPGVWFFGEPSTAQGSQWGVYFTLAAVYGGLLLLMRVWWGMTRLYARCPGVSTRRLMWVFALWATPMMVIAPLFSRDVYSYAAQGEMVSHHMNPYLYGPFELGNNSYTAPVDSLWGNAPAPYGPLFLQVDGFFTRITFHNELATVVLLRLLSLAGVLLIAGASPGWPASITGTGPSSSR